MNLHNFKKFISCFIVEVLILAFLLPNFDNLGYIAATVVNSTTATTRRKPVGHKIEGAEYYEELWDKFSVIAIDNGGGSGEGGGAGDNNTSNAGNSGNSQDAGGTFGEAAGQGLGTGNVANQSGTGSGNRGGSTGSVKADALRALKAKIEESRAESLKRVLETANNVESVAASIAERESIQSSIQKRMQQESIRARIVQAETQRQYETPVFIEETTRTIRNLETRAEISAPTSVSNYRITISERDLTPTPVYVEEFNPLVEAAETVAISDVEPGDFVQVTNAKSSVTTNINQTVVNSPTSAENEVSNEAVTETTLETFDSPIVEEETTKEIESEENETNKDEKIADEEDGKGSKGGQDAEQDEDLTGDDGENESMGMAEEQGQYQKETEGEFAGKRIFELDRNGDLGLNPEHLSVTNMKGLMTAVITLLFLLGALTFVIGTKDKIKKNNYF